MQRTSTTTPIAPPPPAPARAPARPAARRGAAPGYERVYVWQWPIRIFHWVLAAAIATLFVTGLLIAFPVFTATGEPFEVFVMGRVREVHFAAGYVFLIALVWRAYWFVAGNRHARSGVPMPWRRSWWRALWHQSREYLTLDFGAPPLGHNALAGLSYAVFVVGLGIAQVLTGFALLSESNPGGFWDRACGWVIPLLGGSARTHMWHHLFSWGFLVFVILHVYIVLLDDRQYRNGLVSSMLGGWKFRKEGEDDGG